MPDAEGPDGIPGHLPHLLPRTANSAVLLYRDAQVGFVPGDTHADEVMVISPRLAYASVPWHLFDYGFHRLRALAARFVIKVTYSYQPLAIAGDEFLGARHAEAQSQAGFRRFSIILDAQYRAEVYGGRRPLSKATRSARREAALSSRAEVVVF